MTPKVNRLVLVLDWVIFDKHKEILYIVAYMSLRLYFPKDIQTIIL